MSDQKQFDLMLQSTAAPVGRLEVTCPFDAAPLGSAATGGPEHVDAALDVAWRLYRDRDAWLSLERRVAILDKTARLMEGQQEELALLAASEGGKPLPDSRVEVARAIDGIRLCIEHIRQHSGEVIPTGGTAASLGHLAFTVREPIGVVAAISAFNHPLNLIVHQAAVAVAAGCPVIVKPAEDTPLSCLNFVEILYEAGLPPEWCQVLIADTLDTATGLVTDPRVAFLSFIGSARVGWMLRSKLAPGTRCALEHGGVAPVLIAADADLGAAADGIAKGGFYHAGQVCVSVQRVYVEGEDRARQFADMLAERAVKLKVGDPRLADTEVGPLIRPGELTRVGEWVEEAKQGGAEVLCGGEAVGESCYAPTVLYNPPADAKVSCMEIFGPVVGVYPCAKLSEAYEAANSLPFSFQAAVYTSDIDTAMDAWRRLDASAVMVNQHTAFRIDNMPFGGLKESGLGIGGIGHAIDDMQVSKMLVVRSPNLP